MSVSYNNLWKTLIDKNMQKKELCELADISTYTMGRLKRGENVTVDTIEKICKALQCDIHDVLEFKD
ncbi:MAG: helix-turn-helix transcriptional regulator [Clostridia bacterium]|nr:helix-turn-helix transcriptional regulator [Clostridia bacterium]